MLYESKIDLIMKGFFKYIAVALAMTLLAVGCTPEILTPEQGKLPEASAMEVVITPDQTTNYVTFSVKNANGIVPMWIFGEDKVDGKANKKFAYVGNDIVLRIREAGTHQVEVKAYNAHGISVGSKIESYTLENTYRDPFDPTPYMKAVAGEWQWNQSVKGHFGCGSINAETGQATTDGTDWWSCDPDGKADMGLYDDQVTFTAEGAFTYDPGKDGTVYVNWGMAANGYHADCYKGDEQDYQAPIEGFTTTYTIENEWNAAGIEDIYLVLPEGKNLSYIPHKTALDNPRYRFLETATSKIRKTLSLVNEAPTENGGGGIAWKYEFVPAVKVATPEELLAGTDAKGKAWVMDAAVQGHLGCGSSVATPVEWWSAPAYDKKDFGMYDDAITFFPDGKYVYDSGEDGKMYINWGVTVIGPNPGAEPDIDIEQADVESTYVFDGETITLAANTPMVYVPSDLVWGTPVFHVTSLTETTLVVVAENPGCYWQMIFKARDVKAPAGPTINGTELPAEISISQGEPVEFGNLNIEDTWIDPDFFKAEGSGYVFNAVAGDYKFTYDSANKWIKVVPMVNGEKATYENGKALWIIGDGGGKPTVAQLIGWNTGDAPLPCAQIAENKYQITLAMKAEGGSVKVFGQSDWGVEWTKNKYGTVTDNGFFHIPGDDGNIHTIEGTEPGYYTFTFVDNDGILDMTVTAAEIVKPEVPFTPGDQLDLMEAADVLVGTWTWEASTDGHFGCGDAVANPVGWWNGPANCKADGSMYDDTMTFAEDGTYTFDPVDGHTYINTGVTKLDAVKVDQPYGDDWRITAEKMSCSYSVEETGEYPSIVLEAGTYFSYVPNDAFLDAPELYITGVWENQVEISAYTATGNGGGPIAWRYRLKRVN